MTIPKLPFSFAAFVRNPIHGLLFIMITYFVYNELYRVKDDCSELRKIVAAQEKRIAKLEGDKDNLTTALLVKNGIIDEIRKNTDSLVRERVGNEAKKIVKK